MSVTSRECDRCNVPYVFDGMGLLPKMGPGMYGVAWKCPQCAKTTMDFCPLGPVLPAPGACLNCGAATAGDPAAACPECGMTRAAVVEFFGIDAQWSTDQALETARQAFSAGLCRRGLGIVNHALQSNPSIEEAWVIKYQVYQMLKIDGAALDRFEKAAERLVAAGRWP